MKGHAGPLPGSHTNLHKQCQFCSARVHRLRDSCGREATSWRPPRCFVLKPTVEAGAPASDDVCFAAAASTAAGGGLQLLSQLPLNGGGAQDELLSFHCNSMTRLKLA